MHNVRLLPLVKSDSIGVMAGSVTGPGPERKSGANSTRSTGPNSENYATYTADGRVLCHMFNSTKGCSLFNCKFAHLCNLKVSNGQACGQNHPSCRHGS